MSDQDEGTSTSDVLKALEAARAESVDCTRYQPDYEIDDPKGDLSAPLPCKSCKQPLEKHANPFGKPEECQKCPLFREPGRVPTIGPRDANILLVGEKPGGDEVDDGYFRPSRMQPFVGGAGKVLNALLRQAGIDRRSIRITNAVRCRPPFDGPVPKAAALVCSQFLAQDVEEGVHNVIIAAGDVALNVLTGKDSISLYRGVPTAATEVWNGQKVFPTWNSAFIMRSRYYWAFAVHDLVRAKAQSAFPEIRRVPFEIVRSPSVTDNGAAVLRSARERGYATFDFETTGLTPDKSSILMCGLATRSDQVEVYDWSDRFAGLFQEVLDDPGITIIGQNILNFDLPFAKAKGVKIPRSTLHRVFDTMVGFHLTNSSYGQTPVAEQNRGTFRLQGAEKDLAFIASNHTDMEYWKGREHYQTDLREVCGKDVIATHRSALSPGDGILAELKAYDMLDLYWKHVLPVVPILNDMTERGVRVDEDKAMRWTISLATAAEKMTEAFREHVNRPHLNMNSPQQMMDLLYGPKEKGNFGLPVYMIKDQKTKKMRPTANAEALEYLAATYPEHAGVKELVDIRYCGKMESTFIRPGLERGRFHPRFGTSKTATGRLNSWDPNGQNVPEEMRDIWIPDDDDCVLLSADWSQIEWRLAMVMSGDPVGLELLASGVDNHRAVAAETLGKHIEDITDEERHASKFIVYGLGYGRGAESIAKSGFDIDFVHAFIQRFFRRFETFAAWRERNVDFVKKNNYLANPWKRRRFWYTWEVTEVYNFPQQSTAADMMYDALIELDEQLPKDATMRLTVHDEVVLNVPKSIVKDAWACVRDVMQKVQTKVIEASAHPEVVRHYYPNGWTCPVDIHVGTNWLMTKSKNPEVKKQAKALEQHLGLA